MKDSEKLIKCLEKITREKDTGVFFTPCLSSKDHILEITARASRIITLNTFCMIDFYFF